MQKPRFPLFLLALALLVIPFVPGACSSDSASIEGAANRLLTRRPDRLVEERGLLVPDAEHQWDDYGLSGWELTPDQIEDGRAFVQTKQPAALLNLPVIELRDRTLELELSAGPENAGETVELTLLVNDQELPVKPEVGAGRKRFSIETPRPLWKEGDNVLAFRVDKYRDAETKQLHWDKVRVWSVRYGDPRGADFDRAAGTAQLSPGTGMNYLVESAAPATLVLEGTSSGSGHLELTLQRIAAHTGQALGDPLLSRERISAEALSETFALELPDIGQDVLSVELRWDARSSGKLSLARADVHSPEHDRRPPVLFISIDTLGARHLSIYGYERETSPRLAELAEDAVVFERCIANAPWTLPSYLSVLTGLFPQAHHMDVEAEAGVPQHAHDGYQIAPSRWTLAEMLRARGYQTAGYVDTHWLNPTFRVDQGFDLYDMEPADIALGEKHGGIDLIHFKSARWLDTLEPTAPFFLFIHAEDVHGPFWPVDDEFLDYFAEPEPANGYTMVFGNSAFQTYQSMPFWMSVTMYPDFNVPELVAVEPVVQRYDETIYKADHFIGRIIDDLKKRGVYDDTLIIISADHGESFKHDFYSHGAMWEDIVHVPLVIKLPGGAGGGTRVDQTVQLVDVVPTIKDVVGLPDRDYLHGRSLVPHMRGEETPPVPVYSTGGHCEQYLIGHENWKLIIEYPGRASKPESLLTHPRTPRAWLEEHFPEIIDRSLTEALAAQVKKRPDFKQRMAELRRIFEDTGPFVELYDVEVDPGELTNLLADNPELEKKLRGYLSEAQELTKEARADATFGPTGPGLDQAALDALRDLGYIGEEEEED